MVRRRMDAAEAQDVVDKAGTARVLRHLLHSEPINQRQFTTISRMADKTSKELRQDLTALGILKVKHVNETSVEIRLTPLGRELAEIVGDVAAFVRERLVKS